MARKTTALGLSLTVVFALSACSEPSSTIPEPPDVTLTPSGDAGAWMTEDYANGILGTRAVAGDLCGISGELYVASETQSDGSTSVVGR